ncbi:MULTISPECIES: hypothetical protein [Faecalibacterium]|jgi:hypothetical protein|uniref:hypothetical protein n=1 Tax=Faecalibacterium TaxID=216851 RepID=UPI000E50CFB9|nr:MULTISPECIES: hypothetical protein [Faecalibacterium]RHQ22892.1 hypothetical protein DWY95_15905 [Faecalibacterium sp. AF28-13AC]
MTQNGIWLKKGLVPYHLNASELALALLVREKPLSAQQLSAALTEKGIRLDRKQLGKILAKLERAGAVKTVNGNYICQNTKLLNYSTKYSESQLLDIVGLTQHTVNGQAVFSGTPPMSISSRGSSGV